MEIPERVKIGPHQFDVKIVDVVDSAMNLKGQINTLSNCIRLKRDMAQSKQEETLFHEVLHEIAASLSVQDALLDEENVTRIAYGFYQFLVDNDLLK